MRFALITGLLALATGSGTAQSTNSVQRANFMLRGTVQTATGVRTVRLGNKDILAALNATGVYDFGPRATLLFVSSGDEVPVLMVRDGTGRQTTNTDVGDYFDVTEIGDEVRSPNDSTQWQTWNFAFDNGTTNETAFQLWGATTIQRGGMQTRRTGEPGGPPNIQSNVRGVGRVQGAITIFSGTIVGANSIQVRNEQ